MAGYKPIGLDYGVDDTTLTYMYNPQATMANIAKMPDTSNMPVYGQSPNGSGPMLFEPNGVTPMATNSGVIPNLQSTAAPSTQASPNMRQNFVPTPQVAAPVSTPTPGSGFTPISGPAYSAANGSSAYNPMGTATPQAQSMFSGVGETLSNGWDAIGGWQGLQSGLQAATGIFQAYQGMEALGLAEDKFNFQKDAWQANYDMQKDAYDRQVAQVESRKSFLQRGGSELEENQ